MLVTTRIEADEGLQAQATTSVTCCRCQRRSRSITALSVDRSTLQPWPYLVLHSSCHWALIFIIDFSKRASFNASRGPARTRHISARSPSVIGYR
jgi:hypothetical protein